MNPTKKTFTFGAHQVTFETGEIARLSSITVVANALRLRYARL